MGLHLRFSDTSKDSRAVMVLSRNGQTLRQKEVGCRIRKEKPNEVRQTRSSLAWIQAWLHRAQQAALSTLSFVSATLVVGDAELQASCKTLDLLLGQAWPLLLPSSAEEAPAAYHLGPRNLRSPNCICQLADMSQRLALAAEGTPSFQLFASHIVPPWRYGRLLERGILA
jgi:hypothetical protein